jgi:hypothetical protein
MIFFGFSSTEYSFSFWQFKTNNCNYFSLLQIETLRGQTYEGIFRAFSPRLELTLDMVHPVDPKDPSRISEEKVSTMVFKLGDVVSCSAIDTDLDYAIKGKTNNC